MLASKNNVQGFPVKYQLMPTHSHVEFYGKLKYIYQCLRKHILLTFADKGGVEKLLKICLRITCMAHNQKMQTIFLSIINNSLWLLLLLIK